MSLHDLIAFLLTPNGIQTAVAILLSFLAEYIPAFERLSSLAKRYVILAASFIIPALACGIGRLTDGPCDWYQAVYAGGSFFITTQLAHTAIKTAEAVHFNSRSNGSGPNNGSNKPPTGKLGIEHPIEQPGIDPVEAA